MKEFYEKELQDPERRVGTSGNPFWLMHTYLRGAYLDEYKALDNSIRLSVHYAVAAMMVVKCIELRGVPSTSPTSPPSLPAS